jgi:hypothetical protein
MSDAAFKRDLQLQIEPHLQRIERILRGRYLLTLVARYNGTEPVDDADIVLTLDSLPKAISAIERLMVREPDVKPDLRA